MSNIGNDVNGTAFTCVSSDLSPVTGYLWITGMLSGQKTPKIQSQKREFLAVKSSKNELINFNEGFSHANNVRVITLL